MLGLLVAVMGCGGDVSEATDDLVDVVDVADDADDADVAPASDTAVDSLAGDAAPDTGAPVDTAAADTADTAVEDTAEDADDAADVEVAATDVLDVADAEIAEDTAGDTTSTWSPPEPVGCLTTVEPGHHLLSCEGGLLYDVEIPEACTSAPCGLIVDIHGWTMSAASQNANTDMRARGRERGYVVVQPTASLFLGTPTWGLDADAPRVHAFVLDTLEALRIDPKRVHVMGFSQGGGMTWRLLCTHPEVYASAAPIGPITGCSFEGDQAPADEVDILDVHGRHDVVVSYDGTGRPQVDAAVAYWPFGAGVVVEEDADYTVTRWTTPSGTVLEHWAHDYEAMSLVLRGHCFPGSPQQIAFPVAFGCADSGTFEYAALALAFFEAHPKD